LDFLGFRFFCRKPKNLGFYNPFRQPWQDCVSVSDGSRTVGGSWVARGRTGNTAKHIPAPGAESSTGTDRLILRRFLALISRMLQ